MWNYDNTLSLIGLIGGATAFSVGIRQYTVAQKWKRMEWVAATMRDFFREPIVRSALQMIDWNERRVLLFPDHPEAARRYVRVNDTVVARALLPHAEGHKFSAVEASIRDTFDHFLDQLTLIHSFVREGLVTLAEVRSYLEYWISNIGDPEKSLGPALRLRALHTYIEAYGFVEVRTLFTEFGYSIKPQSEEEQKRLRALDVDALVRSLNDPATIPSGGLAATVEGEVADDVMSNRPRSE